MRRSISNLTMLALWVMILCFSGCSYNNIEEPIDCSVSDLALNITSQSNPTSCASANGTIAVEGSGGKSPYSFAVNTSTFSDSPNFTNLGAGVYTVYIKDANECDRSVDVILTVPGSSLSATLTSVADSQCLTNNGSITVNASGGSSPYQYRIGSGSFGSTSSFTSLKEGNYSLTVKDNEGCTITLSATVAHGKTGVSYASQIKPIIAASCLNSNCHGSGSLNGDFTKLSVVQSKSSLIASKTTDKSMPKEGSLTTEQIALISCWVADGALDN